MHFPSGLVVQYAGYFWDGTLEAISYMMRMGAGYV
jgi:hypothetical protein